MTERENSEPKSSPEVSKRKSALLLLAPRAPATASEAPDPKEFATTGRAVNAPEARRADSVMETLFRPFRDLDRATSVVEDPEVYATTGKRERATEDRRAASRTEPMAAPLTPVVVVVETHFRTLEANLEVYATTGNPATATAASRAVSPMRVTEVEVTDTAMAEATAIVHRPGDSTPDRLRRGKLTVAHLLMRHCTCYRFCVVCGSGTSSVVHSLHERRCFVPCIRVPRSGLSSRKFPQQLGLMSRIAFFL